MPCWARTGSISPSAASSPRVTSRVFVPYWLDIVMSTPGLPWMIVSPNFGSAPSLTVAKSLSRTLWPLVEVTTTTFPRISGVSDWPSVSMTTRWFAVSTNPAPITPVDTRAALSTSVKERSYAMSRSDLTRICSCRTSPPKTLHLATPGTASRRGLSTQSANVRSSIGPRAVETRPIFKRSIVDEVSGVIFGVFTPTGSWPAVSPSLSASIWRARNTSVPSLKTTVMIDRPWIDSERTDSWLPRPLIAVSTGRVTSCSACSGERPGHSV